jgi:hypothetical protein
MRATLERRTERGCAYGRDGGVGTSGVGTAAAGAGTAGWWLDGGGVEGALAFVRVTRGDVVLTSVLVRRGAGGPSVAAEGVVAGWGSA